MTPERWNAIITAAAETAIDECEEAPTIQKVARKAAELAAEWTCEAMADEGDPAAVLARMKALYRRYLPPDSGISAEEFTRQIIELLDKPLAEEAENP